MSNRVKQKSSASQRVRAASNAGKGTSSTWIWIAVVVVVVVVGVVVIAVGRGSGGSASGGGSSPSGGTVVPNGKMDYGTVSVTGAGLPQYSDASTVDPAAGLTIPQISGVQFDGTQLDIVPTDGTPKVIAILAHWCPHCQAEVPRVQQWLDQSGMPQGVQLYAVATENNAARPNFPAADWLRREKWSVPTIVDDKQSTLNSALGVGGYPFFLAVDSQGKVVYRTSGEIPQSQWNALIEAARTGKAPSA